MPRTMTSREFNHDTGMAKREAALGPVVITDRGSPSFVLLTYESYHRLVAGSPNIVELLAHAGSDDVDFDPAVSGEVVAPARFD